MPAGGAHLTEKGNGAFGHTAHAGCHYFCPARPGGADAPGTSMTPTEIEILHILHVAGALVLMGYTFYALAAPPETRKRTMIWTGSAALVMLLTGLRMWQTMYGFAPAGWLVVKILCWLGLAALAAIAYRRRTQARLLAWIAIGLAVVAVTMVYVKPF
jgi:uncharacterized membrane protein SirB2